MALYKGEQVFFDPEARKVYIEREHTYLTVPTVDERKGLIDEGIVKLINKLIEKPITLEGKCQK